MPMLLSNTLPCSKSHELLTIFSLIVSSPMARDDMTALENNFLDREFFYFGKKSRDIVSFSLILLSCPLYLFLIILSIFYNLTINLYYYKAFKFYFY